MQTKFQNFKPNHMTASLIEGWRGEIMHIAITDNNSNHKHYTIKDPSFNNWQALSMAFRGAASMLVMISNKTNEMDLCGMY